MSLDLKGTAFLTVDGAGPVFVSGRPQPLLTVNGRQPSILMDVLIPNTVPSTIMVLRGSLLMPLHLRRLVVAAIGGLGQRENYCRFMVTVVDR